MDKCDVCGRGSELFVCSSGLGAISLTYCTECGSCYAEPIFMFWYVYEDCGREVADHVKYSKTWLDGKYLTWEEFCNYAEKKI